MSRGCLALVDGCSKDVLKEQLALWACVRVWCSLKVEQKVLGQSLKAAVEGFNRKH